ncbi:CBS domain-containing protein [Candidatus Thiothrix sp. Deng01]|uniref:CBS domain-containing protein n=1 Tax=Candidatus Thiothrix phosphatis TaxID=3112415 RepID=A0ABU6CUD6_9GAMM|nr:CBS domain-containing protein [Candidatus Thiothrix sp. Deng01]MEB4589759.1 CBS domain-containing protein [Candidatus Thiothrix sp. Deng01]
MKTISQVLARKGGQVYSVDPAVSIIDAVKTMAEKRVGALLVLEGGSLKGIISEQDYTRKIVLHDRSAEHLRVEEAMSSPVVVIRPEQSIQEGMAIMTEKRIRHLPVVEGGELVGLVSIGDLVKEVISEQQFMIDQLVGYIRG